MAFSIIVKSTCPDGRRGNNKVGAADNNLRRRCPLAQRHKEEEGGLLDELRLGITQFLTYLSNYFVLQINALVNVPNLQKGINRESMCKVNPMLAIASDHSASSLFGFRSSWLIQAQPALTIFTQCT